MAFARVGVIHPGTVTDELMSHNDWVPTLCAIAGEPDIKGKLLKGYVANGKNYKVHLDGYDQSDFLKNITRTANNNNGIKSARKEFFYSDDDGLLVAYRQGDYKYSFAEQRLAGTMGVWAEPFTELRLQKIYNLFQDPYERADFTSNTYWDYVLNHVGSIYGVIGEIVSFAETFKQFPPRSIPPSFNPTTIMQETLREIKLDARYGQKPEPAQTQPKKK
jgi:arylsulfatase A-like enzyme